MPAVVLERSPPLLLPASGAERAGCEHAAK